ncbi:Ion transport 2 domain protein [Beutenbergia cavernae DSM 12333]|uniref:Ion transport 2 domain protein n=1 Tax=Beutenbergia cavernae (strain ATCC BAA-8 / DSM 12333 / CCUG 43141 / JCM 11478 / NBRC 16432 / NCIMB 13614 / HKI 0122) TaxID=471853 RepID=C5BYQ2_BEUC1|nr:potassium channel family protein [Beutenbergia cavernae]ACQ79010.1 Ion transport 2 domain protein [Beutenbergia cavernae DSM 12333]
MRTVSHRRLIAPPSDDFVAVLVLLTGAYVLYTATESGWARFVVAGLYVLALVLAVRAASPTRRQTATFGWVVAACVIAIALAYVLLPDDDAAGVTDAVIALVLMVTLVLVISRVLAHRRVTVQTIAGALSAYLLIGMLFAAVYGVMTWRSDTPFFASGDVADARSLQYFSFTTLTTLGYGDLTAADFPGRGVATFEALTGQIFLTTLVARLVATFRRQSDGPDGTVGGSTDDES